MDEPVVRESAGQLRPQLVDIHVHGPVTGPQVFAPDQGVQILAGEDPALVAHHGRQQLQLPGGQHERAAPCEGEVIGGPDLQIAGPEHLGFVHELHRGERLPLRAARPVTAP
jgi:hypothetical protein